MHSWWKRFKIRFLNQNGTSSILLETRHQCSHKPELWGSTELRWKCLIQPIICDFRWKRRRRRKVRWREERGRKRLVEPHAEGRRRCFFCVFPVSWAVKPTGFSRPQGDFPWDEREFRYMAVTAATAGLILLYFYLRDEGREISWKDFVHRYLGRGMVRGMLGHFLLASLHSLESDLI